MSDKSAADPVGAQAHLPSPPLSTSNGKYDPRADRSFTANTLREQSWVRTADYVRHRVRGILLTEDTYPLFCLSFESDYAARKFLGELLVSMSASKRFMRMSELQLEDMNASWDDTARSNPQQFDPTEMAVTVAYETTYQISSQAEVVKTLYYIALSKIYMPELVADAICNRELNGLWAGSAETPVAKQVPLRPHFELQRSIEDELKLAIESSRSFEAANTHTMPALVERLVSLTKVGRRERSEPFLNLSEIRIRRQLPRWTMGVAEEAIKFVYWEKQEAGKTMYILRAFITRRLFGSLNKSEMDILMVKALRNSVELTEVLDCGKPAASNVDAVAERLLDQARGSKPAAEQLDLVNTMFP